MKVLFFAALNLLLPFAAEAQSEVVRPPTVAFKIIFPSIPPRIGPFGIKLSQDISEEADFVIFREEPGCVVQDFEVRGGCRASEDHPLGIYFSGFRSWCVKPNGQKSDLSESLKPSSEENRLDALVEQYRWDGPFHECLKPETWKHIASEVCRLSCREHYLSLRTKNNELEVKLPPGNFFVEVPQTSFTSTSRWTGYYYPITPFVVGDGDQSVPVTVQTYRTTICTN